MRLLPLQRFNSSPQCALLEICDFQLLLECPLNLSALSYFLPTLVEAEESRNKITSDSSELKFPFREAAGKVVVIDAEPWYKTADLSRLDVALINAVIISSPELMLGLPFLTRNPEFTASVFVTEAAATLGRLLMHELVKFHEEYSKLYGQPIGLKTSPSFTAAEVTEHLTQPVKSFLLGEYGSDTGNWQRLYSAEDIQHCFEKIKPLRYGEEASIYGRVLVTPYSSGDGIGAANWIINGLYSSLTYVSADSMASNSFTQQDAAALKESQVILLSGSEPDETRAQQNQETEDAQEVNKFANRPWATAAVKFITASSGRQQKNTSSSNEVEKKSSSNDLIGKAVLERINRGGSVLLPVNASDKALEYLEIICSALASASFARNVPVFFVSPSAQEFLAFTNTIPEWLSPSRQEKLYAGESLFGHVEHIRSKRLHHLSSLSSPELLGLWREPCVVLCGHASLRMGPAVHLLHRWRSRAECLLLLPTEPGSDVEQMLAPFKPMSIQVKQISSPSPGPRLQSLLKLLQPNLALVPEFVKDAAGTPGTGVIRYSHGVSLEFSDSGNGLEMQISAELAKRITAKPMKAGNAAKARLSAEMYFHHNGSFYLEMPKVSRMALPEQSYCGTPEVDALLRILRDKGLADVRVSSPSSGSTVLFLPNATIEVSGDRTVIKANDPVLRRLIADSVTSTLQSI